MALARATLTLPPTMVAPSSGSRMRRRKLFLLGPPELGSAFWPRASPIPIKNNTERMPRKTILELRLDMMPPAAERNSGVPMEHPDSRLPHRRGARSSLDPLVSRRSKDDEDTTGSPTGPLHTTCPGGE